MAGREYWWFMGRKSPKGPHFLCLHYGLSVSLPLSLTLFSNQAGPIKSQSLNQNSLCALLHRQQCKSHSACSIGKEWHRILTFAALACELFGLLTKCRVSRLELEDAGHGVGAHVTLPPAKRFVSTLCDQTQTAYKHNHCKSAWCWGTCHHHPSPYTHTHTHTHTHTPAKWFVLTLGNQTHTTTASQHGVGAYVTLSLAKWFVSTP